MLKSFRSIRVSDHDHSAAGVAAVFSQVTMERDQSLLGIYSKVPDEPVGRLDVRGMHDYDVLSRDGRTEMARVRSGLRYAEMAVP